MNDDQNLSEVIECEWSDISGFTDKAEIIFLDKELIFSEVADALIQDDVAKVGAWMNAGKLKKSSADESKKIPETAPCLLQVITPFALVQVKSNGSSES